MDSDNFLIILFLICLIAFGLIYFFEQNIANKNNKQAIFDCGQYDSNIAKLVTLENGLLECRIKCNSYWIPNRVVANCQKEVSIND